MNLINKKVIIKEGVYKGEWGTVRMFDGEYYHVALWDGDDCLVFYRDEIRVPKKNKKKLKIFRNFSKQSYIKDIRRR